MSSGGNLYPNWLGVPSLTIPSNTATTAVNVVTQGGISTYTTVVNVVPLILQAFTSTTALNTANPSEMLSYTVPLDGWYMTNYHGVASHNSGSNWSNFTQLDWYVKKNNVAQTATAILIEPQYMSGDTVTAQISVQGGGLLQASAGDLLEWTVDGNASPAISSGYAGGFSWITIQKIA